VTTALLAQDRHDRLRNVNDTVEVGVDLRPERVDRRVLERAQLAVASAVDVDIDATEPRHGGSDRACRRIPLHAYRARHDTTVCRVTPTRPAISVFDIPSAASSTIRARCAKPALIVEDRTHPASRSRSPSRSPNAAAGRAGTHHSPAPPSV
jgi:hypothetical protein